MARLFPVSMLDAYGIWYLKSEMYSRIGIIKHTIITLFIQYTTADPFRLLGFRIGENRAHEAALSNESQPSSIVLTTSRLAIHVVRYLFIISSMSCLA